MLELAPALLGWLWLAPVTGILGGAAWASHQLDLGNSAKEHFAGHVVHHSIGNADTAIGINVSDRRILVASAGEIEVFPFSNLRFARPHFEGDALLKRDQDALICEAFPSTRMVAELTFEGLPYNVFIQLFDLEQRRSTFGRFAARQRGVKWLSRLHKAACDDSSPAWGSHTLDTTSRVSGF